jgi:ABC-2 type transport system ATP-binding protein
MLIQTRSLRRCFGELVAVSGFTLTVPKAEVFGLVGPNGAGKSTVVKMLTTLLPPTAGGGAVAGWDIARESANVRRAIGYVPQLLSADGALTGYENLLAFAKLYDIPRSVRSGRIAEALDFVELGDAKDRLVRTYSGGMIRRLELAVSLLHRPQVPFLDEPTVGLDPLARQAIWRQIRFLVARHRMTVFLTTHFMDEADALCDRVGIMNRGELVKVASPEDLKASVGRPDATLDDAFAFHTGNRLDVDDEGGFRDAARTRRTAARLG